MAGNGDEAVLDQQDETLREHVAKVEKALLGKRRMWVIRSPLAEVRRHASAGARREEMTARPPSGKA